MSHITADLPDLDEEVQRRHPLVGAQSGLARKVVQVRDQPLQEVLEARIFGLAVDFDGIRRDVVDGEVKQLRSLGSLGVGHD